MSTFPKITKIGIARAIRKHSPETAEDLLVECGFPLTFIAEGSYRVTYRIIGTDYVAKVPIPIENRETLNIEHSRNEIDAYWTIRAKHPDVAHLLPALVAWCWGTGVSVWEYCPEPARFKGRAALLDKLRVKVGAIGGDLDCDLHENNIGISANGVYKITDLGCWNRRTLR